MEERIRLCPFLRHFGGNCLQCTDRKRLDPVQPRLERLPSADAGIDKPVRVESAKRAVWEGPFFGVEAIAEVNEVSAEAPFGFAAEDDLPPVTVAQPLVEDENASKLSQVFNLGESCVGQIVH